MGILATEYSQRPTPVEITPRVSKSPVPLSYGQEQIWLHSQLVPQLALYNEPVTIRKSGSLDVAVLQRALSEIVRRHEAWRTNIRVLDGQPMQVVQPAPPFDIQIRDLRSWPLEKREAEASRLATQDALRPFDFAQGPLYRALLVHLSDDEHRLYLTLHHIIFDGTSIYRVLLPELEKLYAAYSRGESSPLPDLPVQFADFTLWQREWLAQSGALETQLAYWRNLIPGITMPPLPADHQRPAVQSFRGAIQPFSLNAAVTLDLKNLARGNGATLFMTLLAGLAVLLQRYSGSDDIAIGTVGSSRKRSQVEGLLGYFLNPLVLRNDLSGDPSFRDVLRRVRNSTLDALANDDAPFTRIVNETHPARTLSCNPLIQVLFTLEPPLPAPKDGWSVALTQSTVDTGLVKFDLVLELDDTPTGLAGRFKYNTDLFDAPTMSRMAEHFQVLLKSLSSNPEVPISQAEIMTATERNKILVEWNRTAVNFSTDPCIHDLFRAQAEKNPAVIAVEQGAAQITYGELNQHADALAGNLRQLGVKAESRVGVYLQPSPEMLIAILGILKAGGAYVPLDPAYPGKRLGATVEDARLRVVVTNPASRSAVPDWPGVEIVTLDASSPVNNATDLRTTSPTPPDNLAYLIYTSGSTGDPRGVEITHRSLVNSTLARIHYYRATDSRFLLLSSFAFDSSVAGIFGTLCNGGTLVLPPRTLPESLPHVAQLIAAHRITDLLCVPSLYRLILEQATRGELKSLRRAIVAGESCPPELLERHYKLLPGTALYNEYGPTEATVWATVHKCEAHPKRPTVSIGKPIANTQAYVLDRDLHPVPAGVQGELCIAGAGVARGYWNRLNLTAAKFVPNPFGEGKLYRTGDLARHLSDGSLELLGRLDAQIKIRGFRIEFDEIASHIAGFPGVLQAAASVFEPRSGQPEIVVYVVSEAGRDAVRFKELRRYLKDRLPEYMLPSSMIALDALPLLPNGKLDRAALPAPERPLAAGDKPVTPIEERLVSIFEKVLDKHPVGTNLSFFELGGHSLLLAKLLLLIEESFSVHLSWAEVFRFPTVRELATLLTGQSGELGRSAIIPIQPAGNKLPLFWVRGGPLFLGLSRGLGMDQPLLGLDLPPADAVHLPVPYRLEDIAAALINKMRSVQPVGPYNIAGLCVNGVIAFEMARQLQEAGHEVGVLALFDAQNPEYYHNFGDESAPRATLHKIIFHLKKLLAASPSTLPGLVRDRLSRAGQRLNVFRWRLYHHFAVRVQERSLRNLDIIIHPSSYDYRPKPLEGKVLFFQSSDWPKGDYWDFYASWKGVIKNLHVRRVQGGHESMFAEANVTPIIEELLRGLEDVNHVASSGPEGENTTVTGQDTRQLHTV